MDGFKGKWPKCLEVLTKPKDKDSFMRAFMLLALGSVLCPETDNATTHGTCTTYRMSLKSNYLTGLGTSLMS